MKQGTKLLKGTKIETKNKKGDSEQLPTPPSAQNRHLLVAGLGFCCFPLRGTPVKAHIRSALNVVLLRYPTANNIIKKSQNLPGFFLLLVAGLGFHGSHPARHPQEVPRFAPACSPAVHGLRVNQGPLGYEPY